MNTLQKVAFSLIITVVLFSIFIFIGFTGLFSVLETKFYNKRIEQVYIQRVEEEAKQIEIYNNENKERFLSILKDIDIQKIFTSQWDEQYILKLHNLFQLFLEQYPGIEFVWFYDEKGLIHYSTADFAVKTVAASYKRVYKNLKEAVKGDESGESLDNSIIDLELLTNGNEKDFKFILDENHNLILYKYKTVDKLGLKRGIALFVVNKSDLKRYLIQKNVLQIDDRLTFYNGSYLINGSSKSLIDSGYKDEKTWKRLLSDNRDIFLDPVTKEEYLLFRIHLNTVI